MPKSVDIGTQRPDDIKTLLSAERPILMLYRMQMCPHCVALHPTWMDVRKRLSRDNGIMLAEVEYQHMSMLPSSLRNIRGFPTIQLIQNGKVKDEYFGDRSADSIIDFARNFVKSSASTPAKPKKAAVPKKSKDNNSKK